MEEGEARRELVEAACSIIADARFAALFGAEALAEAPIAAVLPDGFVVTGTVDRLLVADDRIEVVDFKTGRTIPRDLSEIPAPHLRQMAAYVAALEVIFPGRMIAASLLYTSGPQLHALPRALLDRYAPARAAAAMEG